MLKISAEHDFRLLRPEGLEYYRDEQLSAGEVMSRLSDIRTIFARVGLIMEMQEPRTLEPAVGLARAQIIDLRLRGRTVVGTKLVNGDGRLMM
jgi:hypothetical protein